MIQIDMQMPEKCGDCIFCDDNCSCVASDYNGTGINVGCAYRTGRIDIRCPLKEQPEIIRCKDCKHRGNSEKCVLSAISEEKDFPLFILDNRGEWFCADGERKSADEILMEEMDADPLG